MNQEQALRETKEFQEYLHNSRNEFVDAINKLTWDRDFRTKVENFLIAFDQARQKLNPLPHPSTKEFSREDCPIGADKHNESIFHLGQCYKCFKKKTIE